ncbi:MAG: hypothetical protein KBC33_00385 [Candidatus Pacebacteria bacterium]|nr:hypothetical protein [Candidatus Paceibacterota bacterium]
MTDICLLLRVGERPDETLRKILFSMAQYMFETEEKYLPFQDAQSRLFTASMATDFKKGRQDETSGTIFRTYVEYSDGRTIEAVFLANYREDWRVSIEDSIELTPVSKIGGDPVENWKN